VHLQFNSGFFNIENFACLIEQQLPRRGVVVTFHRTQDLIDETDGLISLRSIAPTLRRADCLIVHQQADADRLADMGVHENVMVVPIGTPSPPKPTPDEVRMALRLGDRPIVGTFGFLLPHKGILALLDSVDRLRVEFADIALLALCATYPIATSHDYENVVREHIASRKLEENVLLVSDYLPADIASTTLRAADVVVLPYEQTEESASAALRFVMAIERPVVVTDLAIFADAAEAVYRVPPKDPVQLDEAVRRFIRNESMRHQWSHRAAAYSRATSWSHIAAEHESIYALARDKHRARM
jgi:glycosyltransferase involved in cell wall biosynthesis